MNKKAISPLIATVLLIGFTIVLVVLLFTWGRSFFTGIKETTSKQTEQQLELQDYGIKIKGGYVDPDNKKMSLQLENIKPNKIEGFIVRIYGRSDTEVIDTDTSLEGLNIKTLDLSYNKDVSSVVTEVEVIPKVKINEETVVAEGLKDTLEILSKCIRCEDINYDGYINVLDLNQLKTNQFKCSGDSDYDGVVDLNNDGCINPNDVICLKAYYGKKRSDSPHCQPLSIASPQP